MRIGLSTLLALALVVPGLAVPLSGRVTQNQPGSDQPGSNQGADNGDQGWPRKIASGSTSMLIYQPQIEKWEGNQIQAYAAVAVETGASQQPTYGDRKSTRLNSSHRL